ncbi:hypothetical protein RJ639_035396 [Escallonia herrerae]|uniref:Trafficking protein particle complex subunit 5 n=1 Tax=Escallonia herrerae TaxID=1293975 RepID=A0AA88X4M5_9ASTE|nr:hypothetical protein RJ639_035396 [Escallonia herrerae]
MIGVGKIKQYTNVLDKPLSKGKQEVSLSAFAFLFSELVQYNQTQVDNIAELERRLEDAGYAVGARVLELLCHREKGNRRETRLLGILSFVHSTVWKVLFGKLYCNGLAWIARFRWGFEGLGLVFVRSVLLYLEVVGESPPVRGSCHFLEGVSEGSQLRQPLERTPCMFVIQRIKPNFVVLVVASIGLEKISPSVVAHMKAGYIVSFVSIWKGRNMCLRVADSLEKGTEHEDEYMISEKELLVNRFISIPKDMGTFNCGAFVAGIVRGVLDSAGFPAVVTAHFVPVEGQLRPRTTILIKFAEEVDTAYFTSDLSPELNSLLHLNLHAKGTAERSKIRMMFARVSYLISIGSETNASLFIYRNASDVAYSGIRGWHRQCWPEESHYEAHSARKDVPVRSKDHRSERYTNAPVIVRRPVTEKIDLFLIPPNFKMLLCESYDGTGGPMEHLAPHA